MHAKNSGSVIAHETCSFLHWNVRKLKYAVSFSFFPNRLSVLGLLTEAPAPKGLSITQRRISGLLASEGDCHYYYYIIAPPPYYNYKEIVVWDFVILQNRVLQIPYNL